MKIAIAGYGTVGGGVARILEKNAQTIARRAGQPLELGAILVRRDFPGDPFESHMVRDFSAIENDNATQLVVETIGGCGAALDICSRALRRGKHVVTANKQLVAEHGAELIALAQRHGCQFLFEASVGGGIPVLHPLNECLDANIITDVTGILNGTTNYILTQMLENGAEYADALAQAQRLGYAEADPTADVEGIDAGRKACILADIAYGRQIPPERVSMRGISGITALDARFAAAAGMKIKLLGRAIRAPGGAYVFVCPHFIPQTQMLACVGDVFNAVSVSASEVGNVLFYGPGAGRFPTASAVVGDIIDIARHPSRPQPFHWESDGAAALLDADDHPARFFLRSHASREALEQALGAIDWLPEQAGVQGGITVETTRRALEASGAALDAVYPIFEV